MSAEVIAAYGQAWNEPDEAKRRELIERAWADDGRYCDPVADVTGRDAVLAMIAAFREQQAGASIDLTSGLDQHHDRVRFAWAMKDRSGKVMVEGIDAVRLGPDGRIADLVGFWGQPPAQ